MVGFIFLILYFLYLDGSNWQNLIELGLILTLEFQTKLCLHSHFQALVVDQYWWAKITLWTLQTISYNIPMKENLSTTWPPHINIAAAAVSYLGGVQLLKLKTSQIYKRSVKVEHPLYQYV
jgi:hypothetical protein